MIRKISLNGISVEYEFEYKKVKNVNLRVKSDGTVHVSASRRVSVKFIEDFMRSKADFILNALEKFESRPETSPSRYFEENELICFVNEYCREVFPYYSARGVAYPEIKFRKMVSRWGSCQPKKGIVTFSKYLAYAPPECVKYVVLHEFTHFFEANHGKGFYTELSRVCPNYKALRERMKTINIRNILEE